MQFERKCTREVTLDGRSVEKLIEKIKKCDAALMSQYNNSILKLDIFNKQNLLNVEAILNEYNLIVTKLLIINLNRLGERITQLNLPNELSRLQCLLIESFSISIYTINDIKSAPGSKIPGTDFVRFKSEAEFLEEIQHSRLKKTKYFFSTKNSKVKKDLPKIVQDNIEEDSKLAARLANKYNLNLQAVQLVKKINLKSILKNYKSISVKRIWIPQSNGKGRLKGILSLRDKILQKIILFALLPITEYQADSNSFGFRENRNAHQAVSIIGDSFIRFSKINQPTKRSNPKRVSFEIYKNSTFQKFSIKGGNIGGLRKSKRQYKRTYYLFPPKSQGNKNKQYTPYTKYLNVSIVGCFDSISHKSILELTPIANKYKFLLKSWLKAVNVGSESIDSKKIIRVEPISGAPQGSIIGPMICNVILDGLEQALYKICLEHPYYQLNAEQQKFGEQKIKIENLSTKRETNITCVRYADDILIFGLVNRIILEKIENELVKFLQSRGLKLLKPSGNIKVFCPGDSFKYLGFEFCFPDYKRNSIKLNKGRFTKYNYDITTMCNYRYSEYHRSNPFIKIESDRFAKIKLKAIKLFKRSLASEPVNTIINKQNSLIRGICNYYSITRECRIQLNSLEPLFYSRMWKTMKQKFGSKPKKIAFIKSEFIKKGRFCYKRAFQLKPSDVTLYSSQNIFWVRPSQDFLSLNKYLDCKVIAEFNRNKKIGVSSSPLRCDTSFDKQELHDILIEHQDKLCFICFEFLTHESPKELDHEPSVWDLTELIWKKILNQIESEDLQKKYETLLNFSKDSITPVIEKELESNLFLRSVHKDCHKTIDRELIGKEKQWRLNIKDHLDKITFKGICVFRDIIKETIKKYRKLSRFQLSEISSKRNLFY